MEQCKVKLCWMHPESNSKLASKSESCTNCSNFEPGCAPSCQSDCTYYTRCRRAFEIGRFSNNFWDMPSNFQVSSVDHNAMRITKTIRNDICNFVDSGVNLIIFSALSGNGKTLRATSIANTYISKQAQIDSAAFNSDALAAYAYIPKIVADAELYEKFPFDNPDRVFFYNYIQNLSKCDLVVWDDFGYNSGSRIESITLRAIIDYRINSHMSNIFVVNKSLEQLKTVVDNYEYNKVINSAVCVEFKGIDHRANQSYLYSEKGGAILA